MFTKQNALTKVNEFIESCKLNNIVFETAILFGSTANGKINEMSDIDLLVVSNKFGLDQWENAKILAPINKHFSMIDVHPFSKDYFLQGDPFINEIKRTGIKIIG
jgi:predicted nucleotidyltransferase